MSIIMVFLAHLNYILYFSKNLKGSILLPVHIYIHVIILLDELQTV